MPIQYVDKNCDAIGTVAQTYAISAGVNDKLQIAIDGGANQNFTLTAGGARTAAQIAADINATITGATAYAIGAGGLGNKVRIRTTSQNGASSTILFNAVATNANATLGFVTTVYTGSSRIHNTWSQTTGTKQELINQIETQLLACGWTTISGSATTNLLMQSALTPPLSDLVYRLRVKDNAGTCVTLSIENVAGTLAQANSTTSGTYLLPAIGKTWIFTCHKYGGAIRTGNNTVKEFAFFGSVALPTFLQGVITDCAYLHGNNAADASATLCENFGNAMSCCSNNSPNQAMLLNAAILSISNDAGTSHNAGHTLTPTSHSIVNGSNSAMVMWHDNSIILYDALLGFGITGINDTCKIRGYVWDGACVSNNNLGLAATTTFDTHNWIVLTDPTPFSFSLAARGQLLLVTP